MKLKKVFIILVCVLVVVVGGYFVYTKVLKSDNNVHETLSDIKLDSDREYVYDIYYEYDNKHNSIYEYTVSTEDDDSCSDSSRSESIMIEENHISATALDGHSGCFSDLKVPYININSTDATEVNASIKKLYLEYAEKFDTALDEYISNSTVGSAFNYVLTYNYYLYNDILSVLIITGSQYSSSWDYSYITYNFDLTNGKLLSYSDALSKLGYTEDDVLEKVHTAIDEEIGEHATSDELTKAYNLYEEEVSNDTISYMINNIGTLNVALNVIQYVSSGYYDSLYAISK